MKQPEAPVFPVSNLQETAAEGNKKLAKLKEKLETKARKQRMKAHGSPKVHQETADEKNFSLRV